MTRTAGFRAPQVYQFLPAGHWQSTGLTKANGPCAFFLLYKKDEHIFFAELRRKRSRTAEADTTILLTPCLLREGLTSSGVQGVRIGSIFVRETDNTLVKTA